MTTCWVDFLKQASLLFASVTLEKKQVKIPAHNLHFSFHDILKGETKTQ